MPKDASIQTVLVIGAGPIVIGQGCEFDYAGTQACKALKEEGCRVILINPNPATVMTDPGLVDIVYSEPLELPYIQKIIEIEKPDVLLPTMGGQTALNCALELEAHEVLQTFDVRLIGASLETIQRAEDRQKFKEVLGHLGLDHPYSVIITKDNWPIDMRYPRILRTSFSLGGSGSGLVYTEAEYQKFCDTHFIQHPTVPLLVEESVLGWKEFELEVIRDKTGNCIVVCSIENVDPMGVHTGDSITVAPAQTLTDKEYQKMRSWAFQLMEAIGMVGGCNVQFAVHPKTGRMVVIEMNPRVSRSSALASKATGYPIARIATKLALGYALPELRNPLLQRSMPAFFEPSLDYVVTKIPRFDFEKFATADKTLTTQMKSIGEAMGMGRTFSESLQKALQSLECDWNGLLPPMHKLTGMDPWFLEQMESTLKPTQSLVYKRIDSCAGEFPSSVPILYSTYGEECEAHPSDRQKIIIIGSGPNRIGQGLEFDYGCTQAMEAVRELGYEGIMINSNPSTVSTDFEVSDKLYFEPLREDYVMNILSLEKPKGVLIQFGGQTSLMLSQALAQHGYPILGTGFLSIQLAEDRQAFRKLLQDLNLSQPPNDIFHTVEEAWEKIDKIGYPCILRPSYVLGGKGLVKIHNSQGLEAYLKRADLSFPILIEKFMQDAIEVDVDAIADGKTTLICGILQQLDPAGIHSGDSRCILPTLNLSEEALETIKDITHQLARALQIIGLMNVQYLVQDGKVYVLEVNPRASRTIPFVSKAVGSPLVKIATKVMLGQPLREQGYVFNPGNESDMEKTSPYRGEPGYVSIPKPDLYYLKKPIFSFSKLPGADTTLGPEMKSTGEMMLVGKTVKEVMGKANGAKGGRGSGGLSSPIFNL